MNLDEIIEEIKIFYKNHDDLEEILHDLKENNYLDHWANKFCEERFPSNKKLGKALYIISIENAKNSKDYANLAQSIAYYYGLNDKEWAEDIYKKALKSTKDITLTLSIIEDIADEKYINKKAFAKELCLKIEPKISKLSDYILFRDIVKEKIEDKNWADKIVSKSIEVIKKNKNITDIHYDDIINIANYLAYNNSLKTAKEIYNYIKEYEETKALIDGSYEVLTNYSEDEKYKNNYINYCLDKAIEFAQEGDYCDIYNFFKNELEDFDKADIFKDKYYNNMEDEYNEYGSCEEIFKKKIDIKTNKTGYFKLTIIATGGEYGYGIVEDKNKIDIIKNKIKNEDETISSCFYECDKQFVYQYGPSIQESHILLSVYKDEECQDEIDELVYYEDIDNISLNIFEKSNPFITEDIKKECSKDAIEFGGYYIEKRIHFPVVIHIKDDEIFDINNIYIGTVNMDETLSNDEIVDSVFYIRPVVAKKIIQLYKGENNIKEDESLSDYICDIYNDIENNQEIKKILSLCECEVLEVEGKGAKEEQYAILKTLDNKILFNDYI